MVRATVPAMLHPLQDIRTAKLSPEELARKDAWVAPESARLDRELHGKRWTSRVAGLRVHPRMGSTREVRHGWSACPRRHALIDEGRMPPCGRSRARRRPHVEALISAHAENRHCRAEGRMPDLLTRTVSR